MVLLSISNGRIGSNTTYDGVMYNYNQYVRFSGQIGVQIDDTISNLQSYTMSVWFKLQWTPAEMGKNMDIVTIKPGFQCTLTQRQKLTCTSDSQKSGLYSIDGSVRKNNWYILTLKSKQGQSTIQLYEQSITLFSKDSLSRSFPSDSISFSSVILGIDQDGRNDGFVGNIRNFKLFSDYYDDATVLRTQFIYIYPFRNLVMQILLNDVNDMRNDADKAIGYTIGKDKQLSKQIDFMGNIWCWFPQGAQQYYVEFSPQFQLEQYNIPSSTQFSTTSNFNTALQVWFKRSNYANVDFNSGNDEVIFQHTDTTRVYFSLSDYNNIRVDPLNFADTTAVGGAVGFNRWYFLQVITTSSNFQVNLYEADGTQISVSTPGYPNQLKISSKTIQIGQNFNGFIQGMKYYKTSNPPTNGIHVMKSQQETSSDCLMYFIFNQDGLQDDLTFTNFAQSAQSTSLGSNNYFNFVQNFFREYGSTDVTGTISQPIAFDGYTCKDNKEKAQMIDQTSYIQANVYLNDTLTRFTVEFWIKPTTSIKGSASLLSLADKNNKIYTAIRQESDRSIYCYPFYSANNSLKIEFVDYQYDSKVWQHFSCVIDIPNQIVKGQIFTNAIDYVYFNDISSDYKLTKQSYSLYLNVDPNTMSNGVAGAFYYELRFWNYARSQQQIQNSRFHQLDPDIERPYMYVYSKLMSANAVLNQGEIDYSDYSLQRGITVKNVNWITVADLIVCPLGMFKGQYEIQTCYREGIIQLQGFVYKNTTHYFVSSYSIIFLNNYLRDNAYNIYNYTWALSSMNTNNNTNTQIFPSYLNRQSTAQNLMFSYDEVSNKPGQYDLTLNLIDKKDYQNQYTAAVKFRTYSCVNIFDPNSKQSLVYMDMTTQRGVDDAVFYYDYIECNDFKFDQNSVSFHIDINDQFAFQSKDHNQINKTFTLRSQLQSKLPINDYFYLRITGVWKNKTNPQDTLEYNLIYACRYISKIVPKLTPNNYIILKGQTLIVDYQAQYLNLKQSQDSNYIVQWVCPGNLNNYCKDQGGTLKLSYDNFANSGLDFWKTIPISLVLTTNFIQGDGSKQSIASVDISWLNVNPDAKITKITNINSKNQIQVFQIDMNNLDENQVLLSWSINPPIDGGCYINSNYRKQFVLNSSCLIEGTVYNVTGNILFNERQQIIWTSSYTFSIPVSPSKGKLVCSKVTGKAYIDEFQCNTTGWVVQNNPAKYQFFVTDTNNSNQLVPITSLTTSNFLQTALPPTKKLTVRVVDNSGGIAQTDLSINVSYSYSDTILIQFYNSLNLAQIQVNNFTQPSMISNLQFVASALNSMSNQSNLTMNQTNIINNIASLVYNQSQNLNKFTQEEQRRSFLQQSVVTLQLITKNSSYFNTKNLNLVQDSLLLLISGSAKDSLDYLLYEDSFQNQFFAIQENILNNLLDQLNKGNIVTALMDDPLIENPQLSNITIKLRKILGNYEQYLSTKINEGQQFYQSNSAFKFSLTKFSRLGQTQVDQNQSYNDWSYTSYYYPLQNAIQPTSRQTFTVINFKVNPFIGDYYLNQSATSNTSVYFAYRDEKGNYLSGDNIIDKIKIIYKYNYSPFVFLPNVTTCGYIGINDEHWENKSCEVEFNRKDSQITCHCKHMSYYSIIDDYMVRPQKVPLINLKFRNWSSFIVILYVVLVFVIGTIYTFNKDNQDFRYLHHQEEQQGNIMASEDSLTVVSLAFKRKVFFMLFAEKYKFFNLFKIYLMLLHPLFQLKYKLDPETPRFYRFLMLYSRMMLLFGLTFWTIRDIKNFEDIQNDPDFGIVILETVIFIFLGSLILVPVPILLLCCCRSRYYLIDPKAPQRMPSDDEMMEDPNGINGEIPEYVDNVTDVMIDTNIPIKLLFLINAHKIEDIKKDYQGKLRYATGEISEVGKKLYELDADIKKAKEVQKVIYARQQPTQSSDQEIDKKKAVDIKVSDNAGPEIKDQSDFRISRSQIGTNFITQSVLIKNEKTNDLSISNVQGPGGLDSNRPLRPRDPHQYSYDISANKTDQNILDMMDVEFQIHEENENLDDEDVYEEPKRREFQYEGGSREMSFNDQRANQEKQQEQEELASEQDSIDTQLFTDEKKELIEDRNKYGRIFGNILALCFNLSIFISVLAIYVNEGYYDLTNQYVWVIVFFGAQIVSLFITDIIALLILALCVSKWFRNRKTCLATWMRESLYIYEDYKYVVQFANTKIS